MTRLVDIQTLKPKKETREMDYYWDACHGGAC